MVGGGESLCWELRPPPGQGLTQKKIFKLWEKFPIFLVKVIPFPLLSYGLLALFPLPETFGIWKRKTNQFDDGGGQDVLAGHDDVVEARVRRKFFLQKVVIFQKLGVVGDP